MAKITTVVFDLDGTLLNTLDDLADSTNYALVQFGFPPRSVEEVRSFVGNGVRKLMERAVPTGTDSGRFEAVFDCFKRYYVEHCMVKTGLYPGIADLLHELKMAGYKIAIVSNKLQGGVDELYRHYFQDTVQVAVGERAGIRRKPASDMVEIALQELGVEKDEAVYVGDSDVDVATAAHAGLPCISVLWGFRDRDFLERNGPSVLRTALLIYPVCWNPFPGCELRSVLKRVVYRRYDTYLFYIRCVRIPVLDGELSLVGALYASQAAFRVFGKLFGSRTCIFGGFLYHFWLDVVEARVVVCHVVAVISGNDGNSLFEQFALFVDETSHQVYLFRGDRDDRGYIVAVGLHGRIIAFGFGVDDFRGVYANFILLDPFAFQECDDFCIGFLYLIIKGYHIVSQDFISQRPRNLIGFYFHFG